MTARMPMSRAAASAGFGSEAHIDDGGRARQHRLSVGRKRADIWPARR